MTPRQILSLARAGNPARAWSLFVEHGLHKRSDDFQILTLKGRLLKDRAKRAEDSDSATLYLDAADAYSAAAALERDSYPLVNAATLALLGERRELSVALAQETLDLVNTDPDQGENAYWRAATRAEALLILGEEVRAREALIAGIAELPDAWEDHAATLGQFELILAKQGKDAGWLDLHRPPSSLYFSGIIGLDENDRSISRRIEEIITQTKSSFGFGALAAGSDIIIAEALQAAGASLNITLPYPMARFRELSVAPFGEHWGARFDSLCESARRLDVITELPDEEERPIAIAVDLANRVAMGQCVRNAANLKSKSIALQVTGEGDPPKSIPSDLPARHFEPYNVSAKRNPVHRPISDVTAEQDRQEIVAILWMDGGNADSASDFAGMPVDIHDVPGACYAISDDLEGLVTFAQSVLASKSGCSIGLLIDAMVPNEPTASALTQARDLARVSGSGTIVTDFESAMVLTLLGSGLWIEEIGDMKSASGRTPVWSIS